MRLLLFAPAVALFTGSSVASLFCKDVSFELTATAQNFVFVDPPDPTNATAVIAWAQGDTPTNGTAAVSGTFKINGELCSPPPGIPARNALQILIHGATYNQTTWTGLGFPSPESDIYNWPLFATSHGYHTLTIDRLGHGTSPQRPDPISVLQSPLHAEIVHALITAVRGGTAAGLPYRFNKIIYIGHSFGAVMGNILARTHSRDVDALVLGAYSNSPYPPAVIPLDGDAEPAAAVWPARFAALARQPGYLTVQNETLRTATFYGPTGTFDPRLARTDYQGEDTIAAGELVSPQQVIGFQPATGYTGPVLVVTGAEDAVLCNAAVGACDSILNATGVLFPDASRYSYYAVPDAGHCFMLHYSAPKAFAAVHEWLSKLF